MADSSSPRRRGKRPKGPRRLAPPEALEPRNSPGALLPITLDAPLDEPLADYFVEPTAPKSSTSTERDASVNWPSNHSSTHDTNEQLLVQKDAEPQPSAASPEEHTEPSQRDLSPLDIYPGLDAGTQLQPNLRLSVTSEVAAGSALESSAYAEPSEPPPTAPISPPEPTNSATSSGGGASPSSSSGGSSGGKLGGSSPSASTFTGGSGSPDPGPVVMNAPIATMAALQSITQAAPTPTPTIIGSSNLTAAQAAMLISADDVPLLLQRAAGATSSDDAIIAIVDRGGRILGVRVEEGVSIVDNDTLVFAIDGAVAKARTAAFFSNDQAPLTSRTVRFISQSTITQREVQSNPNVADPNSTERGPGFIAPIGLGSHFPPDIPFTPHVDLVGIEHTNRDSVAHPGPDRLRQEATVDGDGNVTGTMGDDIDLDTRFGADFEMDKEIEAPESYGLVSGLMTEAQGRGIGTLPGGIPLYKNGHLVGGIGVFFPGDSGYADFEQSFMHAEDRAALGLPPQTTEERTNAPKVIEAEFIASQVALNQETIAGIPPLDGYELKPGRIDLVGITLESIGPHRGGLALVQAAGRALGEGNPNSTNTGDETMPDMQVVPSGIVNLDGAEVPEGWLVEPRAGGGLTEPEVREIIERGIAEAELVRSAIRLPIGQRSRMVLAVTDLDGNVLGLYRMPDSTVFSIDVAVAKARNVAYYADAGDLQPEDMIDENNDGNPEVAPGVAFSNRTFRFLSTAYYPSGIDGTGGGPFSKLNDPNVNSETAENIDNANPAPASAHESVFGFDAFNPGSNFREPVTGADAPVAGRQNGVVFFPGSTPLYKNGVLVGGLGVSGDGVDQDDVVTFVAAGEMLPRGQDGIIRADEVFVRGVRLPFQKFLRNPHG